MKNIRTALIRIARRIGAWLIRRFAKWVGHKLLAYMEHRIADWKLRKVPPKGRIRRWTSAAKWIREHLPQIAAVPAKEFEGLADHLVARGVPESVAA